MNALVTGGTGFIGSHLIERLRSEGHTIRCIALNTLKADTVTSLGAEVVLGDLRGAIDWDAMLDGIDVVYHLAGVTRARTKMDYITGNTDQTRHVAEACAARSNGRRRFVYVSSLTAVGPSRDGNPVTEETPCAPVSHYGHSKWMAEGEVLRFADRMPVTIVRPAGVYGPRDRDMFEYIKMARRGYAPIIGFDTKWIDLVHARDLADGIYRAGIAPKAEGEVYLLGGPRPYRTTEIGQAVAQAADCDLVQIPLPHALVYTIGLASECVGRLTGMPILFNVQKAREGVQKAWTCSSAKAARDLGYRPRTDLFPGMEETYAWYCAHGWLPEAPSVALAH